MSYKIDDKIVILHQYLNNHSVLLRKLLFVDLKPYVKKLIYFRQLYVPLPFWFTAKTHIPIIALPYRETNINIELPDIKDLIIHNT